MTLMSFSLSDYLLSKGLRDVKYFGVIGHREAGFNYFFYVLKCFGLRVVHVQQYNKGRHRFVEAEKDGKRFGFYVKFCKDTFHSFNFEFKSFVEEFPFFSGHGESINVEFLEVACRKSDYLVFVYEDGRVYFTYPKLIKNFCREHNLVREQNRENGYNRQDFSGTITVVNEVTYSFPLCLLKNFNEWKVIDNVY